MADKKVTDLTATTTIAATDLFPIVTNMGTTPTTKKIAASDAAAGLGLLYPIWTAYTSTVNGTGGSAGTYAETVNISRYCILGKLCFVVVSKYISNKGSWSGTFRVAKPIASINTAGTSIGGEILAAGATTIKGRCIGSDDGYFSFHVALGTTMLWSDIAVNDWILIRMFYEIA
jgi:hypothetical protein